MNAAQNRLKEMVSTLGRAAVSSQFPNDFEVYLCSLELATAAGQTIDFLTFPIMPSSIQINLNKRTTLKNTAGGIVALTSPIFTPSDITLSGNFGKYFKILIGDSDKGSAGVAFSTSNGIYDITQLGQKKTALTLKTPAFDVGVKTGYGAIRILQAMISKSNGVDADGKPFQLFFYNMAFGESYLVTIPPQAASFRQNEQKNMIWEYTINMNVVAPLEAVKSASGKTSMIKSLLFSTIQKSVNDLASYVSSVL